MPPKMNHSKYCEILQRKQEDLLSIYRTDSHLIGEHYGIEEVVLGGGYEYRQVVELIQNGADYG
ncbi:MAG: hypothetical protein JJU29_22375 [Verrucomicrobia bacterium]|nr:hypothetical protein [Verrucomicrobiota bacterium]MCH8514554.1 hypothetical protein [Kiritimatiellia bacterium]